MTDHWIRDLRYAWRQLRRNPTLTAVIALSLGLGMGANTAIFSLIHAVMLRNLPVRNPGQLVLLRWRSAKWPTGMIMSGHRGMSLSFHAFEQARAENRFFSSVFGFAPLDFDGPSVNMSTGGESTLISGEMVAGGYFSGLGVLALLGRALTDDDQRPGVSHVAVISYSFWTRRFGRDPLAVGKSMTLNGVPFTVVGITPPEFFGVQPGRAPDVWIPIVDEPNLRPWSSSPPAGRSMASGDWWWIEIMARLKPGVSEHQASAALNLAFQQQVSASIKPTPQGQSLPRLELVPGSKGLDLLQRRFSQPLFILTAMVGLVLLIACANVATLLLARATARQREIGIRLALGASRARLIRQLLTESVLLAVLGGALGLLLAYWGSHSLLLLLSGTPGGGGPITLDVHPDAAVLAFTAAVSLLTGILFGLAPAFRATRVEVTPVLKDSAGRTATGGPGARRELGKLVVIAQIALSLPLVVGAGLFVRTLENLENQDLGFNRQNLLLFGIDPARSGYQGTREMNLYGQLLERVQALPGVQSATLSRLALISGWQSEGIISVEGYQPTTNDEKYAQWNDVGPRFLETMGIRLLLGRGIEARDTATSPKAAVVNEAMVRRYWNGMNPLGRRFKIEGDAGPKDAFEVVGVVQNAKYAELRDEPQPAFYVPYTQMPLRLGGVHFALRTAGDPMALIPSVFRAVHEIDPGLPLADVKSQTEQIEESVSQERVFAVLSSCFGLLALGLACVGLYGTMAYAVSRRTHEIGIRMALGAEGREILWMVLRATLALGVIGVGIGLPVAWMASRLVSSRLFGLQPTDPATVATAAVLLAVVSGLAGYLPARRASRVDPMEALRYE